MNETLALRRILAGALLASLTACTPIKLEPLDLGGASNTPSTTDDGASDGTTTGGDDLTSDGTTGDATESPTTGCDAIVTDCAFDEDRDGVIFACDNAPDHPNPDQADADGDGFGDVIDQCPTLPSESNASDEDKDGFGNDCDLCRLQAQKYNEVAAVDVAAYMLVRNIPGVGDADGDGIGDACDNCVRTPNCQDFGSGPGLTPYTLGTPIADLQGADCQADADHDLVGDACAGTTLPGAAGPVGLAPEDDFDQDGLSNIADACPRQPVVAQACDDDSPCPDGAACTNGVCNHTDLDMDGVGDICDSCPFTANPKQIIEGGAEEDDTDGDFIGNACEGAPQCMDRSDPRPIAFYTASVNGLCCVKQYDGGGVLDPDGVSVEPPPKVLATPGLGVLPPGCAAEGEPVTLADVGGDPNTLWQFVCRMPQLDQELDGVPDMCDYCPFAFDPDQEHDGVLGKLCTGAYDPSELDPAMMCLPGT